MDAVQRLRNTSSQDEAAGSPLLHMDAWLSRFTLVMGLALQDWALSMPSSGGVWWGPLERGGGSWQPPLHPPHHTLSYSSCFSGNFGEVESHFMKT